MMKVQKKLSNNEIKSLFITVNKLNEIHSSQDSRERKIYNRICDYWKNDKDIYNIVSENLIIDKKMRNERENIYEKMNYEIKKQNGEEKAN